MVVSGKVKRFGRRITFDNPEFQPDDGSALLHAGRIVAHGYTIRWGYQAGECFGVGYLPVEVSPEGIDAGLDAPAQAARYAAAGAAAVSVLTDGPGFGGYAGYNARGAPPALNDDGTLAPTSIRLRPAVIDRSPPPRAPKPCKLPSCKRGAARCVCSQR